MSPLPVTRGAADDRAADLLTPAGAYARALAGEPCAVLGDDGSARVLQAHRWLDEADGSDRHLFVTPCTGPTLDVGCGPGRLLVALQQRGVMAHGIDVSAAAVDRARASGASATQADVFSALPASLPGVGRWAHVLLADGNIGIGGRPARLLTRVRDLLTPSGRVHVELDAGRDAGRVVTTQQLRLHVGGRNSTPFRWATVGAEAVGRLADETGLRVLGVDRHCGRAVAVLGRVG